MVRKRSVSELKELVPRLPVPDEISPQSESLWKRPTAGVFFRQASNSESLRCAVCDLKDAEERACRQGGGGTL